MKALAIVRCGDASLHGAWANGVRNFDVAISYFGDDHEKTFPEATYVHRAKGGKWDGLAAFFQEFPEAVEKYDYFWLPDDDILATTVDINALLDIGEEHHLHVFQPALDEDSYYSHLITLKHPSFRIRYTNFVEIMAPVLSRQILKNTLPLIQTSRSGFGLDFLWPQMVGELSGENGAGCAIVDDITITHTRAVGGSLHKFMEKVGGRSASDEMVEVVESLKSQRSNTINGVRTPRIRNLSGVDRSNRTKAGLGLMVAVTGDLLFRHANSVQPIKAKRIAKHAMNSL